MTARAAPIAVALAIASPPAHAGDHPSVDLAVDPCVDVPSNEIRRVVAVELGALLDEPGATSGSPDHTRVTVECTGTAAVLRVDDPITGKSLARTIELGDAGPARGRLVALAIVELVSASWTELELDPRPALHTAGPQASARERDAVLEAVRVRVDRVAPPSRTELALGASSEKFFSGTALLSGATLQLTHDPRGAFGWMFDVDGHHGTESASIGRVSTDVLSLGAAADVHREWQSWRLRLGAGLRAGAVHLSGVAAPMVVAHGDRFWAPWFGPLALASVEKIVARNFVIGATLEGGYVVSPVAGLVDAQRSVAVDGAWLELRLGIGMFL